MLFTPGAVLRLSNSISDAFVVAFGECKKEKSNQNEVLWKFGNILTEKKHGLVITLEPFRLQTQTFVCEA